MKALFQRARAELRLQRTAEAQETLRLAAAHGVQAEVEKLLRDDGLLQLPAAAAAAPAAAVSGDPAASAKEKGNTRYKAGEYKEALAEYKCALDLLPGDDWERRASLLGNVAAACLMLRRVAECIVACESALALDAANSKIRARLATAQAAKGDFDAARATLGTVDSDATVMNTTKQLDELRQSFAAAHAGGEPARALSLYADLETRALFDCPALALKM